MEDFNIENNDDILRRILNENYKPLKKIINDKTLKEIGDRVVVLDYSSVTHLDGEMLCDEDYDEVINIKYYIVIATNKKVTFTTLSNIEYKQDLIIVNPETKKQYRVISRHIRIYYQF